MPPAGIIVSEQRMHIRARGQVNKLVDVRPGNLCSANNNYYYYNKDDKRAQMGV